MIKLPSTTRIGRKMPKERFYEQLKLTSKQRESFVRLVDSIIIENSIKPSTMKIADGQNVHEIFLLDITLKEETLPSVVIEAIAKANPHRVLFLCSYGDTEIYAIYRQGKVWTTEWLNNGEAKLVLHGDSLDSLWDSLCSQVIFGSIDIQDVDGEIRMRQKTKALDEEIAKLERAHGKERQIGKRNALFEKLQEVRREKDALMKG